MRGKFSLSEVDSTLRSIGSGCLQLVNSTQAVKQGMKALPSHFIMPRTTTQKAPWKLYRRQKFVFLADDTHMHTDIWDDHCKQGLICRSDSWCDICWSTPSEAVCIVEGCTPGEAPTRWHKCIARPTSVLFWCSDPLPWATKGGIQCDPVCHLLNHRLCFRRFWRKLYSRTVEALWKECVTRSLYCCCFHNGED